MLTFLSGGTGTPKLLQGARKILDDQNIAVVVNTAEDIWYQGGHLSPDVDTVLYLFAGMLNTDTWWGIRDDTFITHQMIKDLGSDAYIAIGDRDRAVQIVRAGMLDSGHSLTQATVDLARKLKVSATVLPMTDHQYVTHIRTDDDTLIHFQEYWVRHKGSLLIREVLRLPEHPPETSGEVLDTIRKSDAVIIGPSNPVTSILPILECGGIREALAEKYVIAVSPFIGDQPISGPAGALMKTMGYQPDSMGVVRIYEPYIDLFIQDIRDPVVVPGSLRCDTLMKTPDVASSLMEVISSKIPM